jgi:hypothetical protein
MFTFLGCFQNLMLPADVCSPLLFFEMDRLISMIKFFSYRFAKVQQKWHMFFFPAPKVPTGLTYVALSLHFPST